jgi:hypothetical protein
LFLPSILQIFRLLHCDGRHHWNDLANWLTSKSPWTKTKFWFFFFIFDKYSKTILLCLIRNLLFLRCRLLRNQMNSILLCMPWCTCKTFIFWSA